MTIAIALTAVGVAITSAADSNRERPDIFWLTCEDISPYLGCYGCEEALTPNIDALALWPERRVVD
ncbi:secreted protein [Rhodopirellula sp. SWK7]|nr:secreted protein [Rhodopirellula sp. SWK7]